MNDITDQQLAEAVAAGEHDALAETYRRYGNQVFALAVRVLGDRQLAEDITQEVFVQFWERSTSFDPQRGSLRALLLTRTHGRCVDVIRARNASADRAERAGVDRSRPAADAIDAALTAATEAELVRAAVDRLPEEERTVLQLAYFGANTYRQVASMLALPEGTVKTRMRAALSRLRTDLHDQFFGADHDDTGADPSLKLRPVNGSTSPPGRIRSRLSLPFLRNALQTLEVRP